MTNTGETTDWTTFDATTGDIRPVTLDELYDLADMINATTTDVEDCTCIICNRLPAVTR